MLQSEFLSLIETKAPTAKQYEIIEKVYNWHPAIDNVNGKQQIASLYDIGGMMIIMDMLPRAEQVLQLHEQITSLKRELNAMYGKMHDLDPEYRMP